MKKFKCIKEYPGSPRLGTINDFENATTLGLHLVENQPEFWEEVVEKDYEILSFICTVNLNALKKGMIVLRSKHDDSYFCTENSNIYDKESKFLKIPHWNIHSVKRLSDGEIFTIGDKIKAFNKTEIINKFYQGIHNSQKHILFWNLGYNVDELVKIKQPLFTTEDGVDIFEGDTFYYVKFKENRFSAGRVFEIVTAKIPGCVYEPKYEKYFSTIEKAKEYILMNKKSLSVEDVLSVWSELSGNTRESLLSQSVLMFNIIKFLKNK